MKTSPLAALLLATDGGLYELKLLAEPPAPDLVIFEPAEQDRALYAVETVISEQGKWAVIVATQAKQGIYLSVEGGRAGSFGQVGPAPGIAQAGPSSGPGTTGHCASRA